jgi:hypothetical protein
MRREGKGGGNVLGEREVGAGEECCDREKR